MPINSYSPANSNSRYDGTASFYDRRTATDFPRGGINARPGCQINPEFEADSPEDSYEPENFTMPQDTYVPHQEQEQPPNLVPYSGWNSNRNRLEPNSSAPPAFRPTPAARSTAASKVGGKPHGGAKVTPLRQSNSYSCGQTSVAMSVNYLTGRKLTDKDIDARHGFGLLSALNAESRGSGYKWSDNGNFRKESWPAMERRLNQEKTPILMGLNGKFSASGNGHIVTLMSINGDKVTYADPADGKVKTTTKKEIENAPGHPDGKFMFVASKV